LVCFVGFSCVTLYKGLSGEASCGCFGKVEISPWYTLAFDICAVLAMLAFRPGRIDTHPMRPGWGRLAGLGAFVLAVAVSGGWTMANYQPAVLDSDGDLTGDGEIVVLEPEKWIGKRCPLLRYVDITENLTQGKWLVLLYHHECVRCREAIQVLQKLSKNLRANKIITHIALIDMPPYSDQLISSRNPSDEIHGRLDNHVSWFAATPVLFLLENGIVRRAWRSGAPDLLELVDAIVMKLIKSSRFRDGIVLHQMAHCEEGVTQNA